MRLVPVAVRAAETRIALDLHAARDYHFFLFCRMPAPELEGQFDDAPIDKLPKDIRQQYNYIDDTPSEHSDDISEGDDDFDSEELDYDHARVEDEDWEIAERGGCSNPTLQISPFLIPPS